MGGLRPESWRVSGGLSLDQTLMTQVGLGRIWTCAFKAGRSLICLRSAQPGPWTSLTHRKDRETCYESESFTLSYVGQVNQDLSPTEMCLVELIKLEPKLEKLSQVQDWLDNVLQVYSQERFKLLNEPSSSRAESQRGPHLRLTNKKKLRQAQT